MILPAFPAGWVPSGTQGTPRILQKSARPTLPPNDRPFEHPQRGGVHAEALNALQCGRHGLPAG